MKQLTQYLIFAILFLVAFNATAQDGKTYTLDALEAKRLRENSDKSIPVVTDAEIEERLSKLSNQIPMTYNRLVRSHIKAYTVRRRRSTETIIGRSSMYFPIFENALMRHGLPTDLKYLPIIESALNPIARSPVGATGLWQFMKGTGLQYNLRVNKYVDERSDPFAASDAAARFLQDLYERYHDWHLVIAAYNCGPGRVNKAMKKANSSDYWSIIRYLPKETRNYVPAFIAAAYTANYYHLHNIYPEFPEYDLQVTEKIRVFQKTSFQKVAMLSGTPLETVKRLNPSYRKGFIPSSKSGYLLILPMSKMTAFRDGSPSAEPAYFASSSVDLSNEPKIQFVSNSSSNTSGVAETVVEYKQVKEVYRVRKGDNLGKIARKQRVTVRKLRKWNKLRSSKLRINQKLIIYKTQRIERVVEPLVAAVQPTPTPQADIAFAVSAPTASQSETTSKVIPIGGSKSEIYYDIRRGDTLWKIASRYDNVTVQDLIGWNSIGTHKELRPGMQLKIYLKK